MFGFRKRKYLLMENSGVIVYSFQFVVFQAIFNGDTVLVLNQYQNFMVLLVTVQQVKVSNVVDTKRTVIFSQLILFY